MKDRPKLTQRCEYKHKLFKTKIDGTKYDGTGRCWMESAKPINGQQLCILHNPEGKRSKKIQQQQTEEIESQILEWINSNKEKPFILPGMISGEINLPKGVYKGDLILDDSHVTGDLWVNDIIFNKKVSFEGATVKGDSSFIDVKGLSEITIKKSQLLNLLISDCEFKGNMTIKETTIEEDFTILDTKFLEYFFFNNNNVGKEGKEKGGIFIHETTFHTLVDCVDCVVWGDSYIEGIKFNNSILFYRSVFYDDVSFAESNFLKNARFNNVKFKSQSNFCNTTFKQGPDMSEVKFSIAPQFHNSSLSQGTDFRGAEFFDQTSRESPACYRTLKVAMNKVSNKIQEGVFYGLEQQSLRNQYDATRGFKFFSKWYQRFSNYGQSYIRPLLSLGIINALFFIIFALIKYPVTKIPQYIEAGFPEFFDHISTILSFIFSNIPSVFKFGTGNLVSKTFGDDMPALTELMINSLALVQSILSLTLITLFVLALRRTFKLN